MSLVTPSREIRSLTGLRGVAAVYVVFYHLFQGTPTFVKLAYTLRGYLSVDLFFVLSGFVMTLTYRKKLLSGGFGFFGYAEFIYKRLARVYPVYFVICMGLVLLGVVGLRGAANADEVVANLLLVQAWGFPTGSLIGPGWSISTEFAAYFLFPLIAFIVLKSPMRGAPLVLFVAAGCVYFAARTTNESLQLPSRHGPLDVYTAGTPYPLIRCMGGFALGIVACRLASSAWCKKLIGFPHAADIVFLAVLVALRFPALDVLTVMLFVPFIVSLSYENSYTSRLFGWGFVYESGVISYSIYLIHGPLIEIVRSPIEKALADHGVTKVSGISGLILLLPLVGLAMASYRWIEKPARDGARRLKFSRSP